MVAGINPKLLIYEIFRLFDGYPFNPLIHTIRKGFDPKASLQMRTLTNSIAFLRASFEDN